MKAKSTSATCRCTARTKKALTHYRRRDLGIVFQSFNLLPTMSVLGKRLPAADARGPVAGKIRPRAMALLDRVGMTPRAGHLSTSSAAVKPSRTAIARALIHQPAPAVGRRADGNLDSTGAARVLEVFRDIAAGKLTTLVIVTHSEEVARAAGRRIRLRDGRLEEPEVIGDR